MAIDNSTLQRLKEYLPSYLASKGINTRSNFTCLNPGHDDKNPSMAYYADGLCVKCFSCNETYDIIELIRMDYGLDFIEAVKKGCEMYGIDTGLTSDNASLRKLEEKPEIIKPPVDHSAYIRTAQGQINDCRAVEYLQSRGINIVTASQYGIGYNDSNIIAPHSAGGYAGRSASDKKIFKNSTGESGLFNLDALQPTGEPVFICESFIDALSIIEAGGNAIALNSTSNAGKLINAVKTTPEDQRPYFIIATDNDAAGEKARLEIINSGIKADVFPLPEKYNDVNDMHKAEPEELKALVKGCNPLEIYRKQVGAGEWLSRLQREADTAPPPISTGFNSLDAVLSGGLMPGLYALGGLSSFGKTTYALQVAEQIAQQNTTDVLFFSLEMSATELVARGVSRRTWTMTNNREKSSAATDIMLIKHKQTGKFKPDMDTIAKAYSVYDNDVSDRLYIHQMDRERLTIEAIENKVQHHISRTGNVPVIFIDYLQIITTADGNKDKRLEVDHIVTTLKRLSREHKTPVVVIASLNRANYNQRMSFDSFKESGGIEYSCDVLIGLQGIQPPPEGKEKPEDTAKRHKETVEETRRQLVRGVEIVVLKNRNGKCAEGLFYRYTTPFNDMEEMPDGTTAVECYRKSNRT